MSDPSKKYLRSKSERSRRAREEAWLEHWPIILASAYDAFTREGRGAIYLPCAHERAHETGVVPLYVQAAEVLRHVTKPSLPRDLEDYDPHTEAIVIFAYPESVYVRRRCALDIATGERLAVGLDDRE